MTYYKPMFGDVLNFQKIFISKLFRPNQILPMNHQYLNPVPSYGQKEVSYTCYDELAILNQIKKNKIGRS